MKPERQQRVERSRRALDREGRLHALDKAARARAINGAQVAERERMRQQAERERKSKPVTEKERKAEQKRARLLAQGDAARKQRLHEAGLPAHDARTAAARRELETQTLGGTKRLRSLAVGRLFKSKPEATWDRVLACEKYDAIWHAAHQGDFPEPKFEPGVDSSPTPGNAVTDSAGAKEALSRLEQAVGRHGAALMYHRIILGMSYRGLAADGHGDERALAVQFVAAVDAAARFFGLKPEARLVERMKETAA